MENVKPNNTDSSFNLEKSLSPLWKSTYYLGLAFDWCRPIPKQSWLSKLIRCFVIFSTFAILLYSTCSSALQLLRVIRKPESTILDIVTRMATLSDQLILLFVCYYFIANKAKMLRFFTDWKQMEGQLVSAKSINSGKIKRTCIIVYALYYIYNILVKLLFSIYLELVVDIGNDPIVADNDLIASYYPKLVLNPFYATWIKFQGMFPDILFPIFCPLLDITPVMVYYYASQIVEGMKSEVVELTNDPSTSVSKSGITYNLWSRFEALTVLVGKADNVFGPLVIICQGYLFSNICICVYLILQVIDKIQDLSFLCLLIYLISTPLIRLLFSLSFTTKLYDLSCELSSTVALRFNKSLNYTDKEERKVLLYFLNRLNQIKLAAHPSGFYKIKPSIYLTKLSLVVTYTIILLQSNNKGGNSSFSKSFEQQQNNSTLPISNIGN